MLVGALALALACNPSEVTNSDAPTATESSPASAAAVIAVSRVTLAPTDTLRIGPAGAKGVMVGRAWNASGKEVAGATLKFWTSSTSFTFRETMCSSPCTDTVLTTSTGVGKVILSQYGGTARDTAWVKVSSTPSGPGDPTPPPPPPPDTTTVPPPAGAGAQGCPTSGYTRLVNVSSAPALTAALKAALPGDQIRLAAGTYLGKTDLARSGTASARIVLCGMPGVRPVLRGGRFKNTGSWVVVTGLVFDGPNGGDGNVFLAGGSDVQFTGNEVRNSDWHYGVSAEQTCRLSITNNYIHDNGDNREIDHGIYFRRQLCPSLIANNVITRSAGRGISLHDNTASNKIENVRVVNNTIVRNGSTGILMALNGGTGTVVANNVLADNGLVYDYKQLRVKDGTNGNRVQNNIVWSPVASRTGVDTWPGTSNTVTGNSTADPRFIAAYGDLRIQSGSPAVGLGIPQYEMPTDYLGKSRSASPDAGAYQH